MGKPHSEGCSQRATSSEGSIVVSLNLVRARPYDDSANAPAVHNGHDLAAPRKPSPSRQNARSRYIPR